VAKNPRVLLIGLDSADAELIERWVREGDLPTFARLICEGSWSRLRTTAEVMHVSAWPTLYTGATPGRHGMYHAYQVRAGSQLIHRTLPDWCALPPFWKFLDDAGRRCIIMDAFMDYPLEEFKGIQICEYGTWTWFSEPYASRTRLLDEIVKRFGSYPAPEHSQQVTIPDQLSFRDKLVRAAAVKGEAVTWLLAEYPWDMAFVTFGEPHGGGHYLWHTGDPDYPIYRPVPDLPHPLKDVYAAVDHAIGHVLAAHEDERTTVLITSGDGMGPNYSGAHLMPDLLHRMGVFFAPTVGHGLAKQPMAAPKKSLAATVRNLIPLSVRQSISRCLPRSVKYKLNMKWVNADIDWQRTQAFAIPNSNEGYVRINLEGREPKGNVSQGERYRELMGTIKAELDALVNPATGHRCAHGVYLVDEVFEGAERKHLPDVVISWDFDAKVLDQVEGPAAGHVEGKCGYDTPAYYTGNHRANAFLLGHGAGIARGATVAGGHIVDIASTVLALLGVDAPAQFEGRDRSASLAKAPSITAS
jgi:predicted AlkP superfamily phosphohydrolase/phosphomutase